MTPEIAYDFFDDRFAVVLGRPPSRAELSEAVRSEVILVNVVPAPRVVVYQCAFADAFNVWVDGWLRGAGLESSVYLAVVWALEAPAGQRQPTLMDEAETYMRRARASAHDGHLWAGRPIL